MYVYLSLVILAHNYSEQIPAMLYCISGQKVKKSLLCLEMFCCVIGDSYL